MPDVTHAIVESGPFTRNEERRMNSRGAVTLSTSDEVENREVIYIYNLMDIQHVVNQPPLFPAVIIPKKPQGKEFSVTLLPRYVRERYEHVEKNEFYYKVVDGRKCATSLMNPAVFPGTDWNQQLGEGRGLGDQSGNNLNAYGVFWSLTHPDDPKLKDEIKLFKARALRTMQELVAEGERLAAAGELKLLTPRMHFAMDYLGLQAQWHMQHQHKIACPNCGDLINEGLAYHRNAFGERCILDRERFEASVERSPAPEELEPESSSKRQGKSRKVA